MLPQATSYGGLIRRCLPPSMSASTIPALLRCSHLLRPPGEQPKRCYPRPGRLCLHLPSRWRTHYNRFCRALRCSHMGNVDSHESIKWLRHQISTIITVSQLRYRRCWECHWDSWAGWPDVGEGHDLHEERQAWTIRRRRLNGRKDEKARRLRFSCAARGVEWRGLDALA